MHPRFCTSLVILVIVGLAVEVFQIEVDKSKLRRLSAYLRENDARLTHLRAESVRDRALIAQYKMSSDAGAKAIHAELLATQAELASLEMNALGSRADASATPSIEANRDPTTAMTRLEFVSNVGRATPEAAFQTLIWAAMKGREPEMAACLALDNAARMGAESLLATLSTEERSKSPTPEHLVGLLVSRRVLEATAVQIVTSSVTDGDHATLTFRTRVNGREGESKIPMVRSTTGWSMAIGENQIDEIRRGLTAGPPKH